MALRNVTLMAMLAGLALSACGHDQERAALNSGMGLYYNDQGSVAALAYGAANSDDVGLMLQCVKGSGRVEVSDVARQAPAPRLILTSAGRSTELPVALQSGMSDGPPILTADTSSKSDALAAFRKSGRINVTYGKIRYGLRATSDEKRGVEEFFTACEGAA